MKPVNGLCRDTLKSALAVSALAGVFIASASAAPRVLQVGTFHGVKGQYESIQAAVNASNPGDWILIGPGDYHENAGTWSGAQVGVWITTPGIHLRGMDRNQVIVDGTLKTSAQQPACSASGPGFGCLYGPAWAGVSAENPGEDVSEPA